MLRLLLLPPQPRLTRVQLLPPLLPPPLPPPASSRPAQVISIGHSQAYRPSERVRTRLRLLQQDPVAGRSKSFCHASPQGPT